MKDKEKIDLILKHWEESLVMVKEKLICIMSDIDKEFKSFDKLKKNLK